MRFPFKQCIFIVSLFLLSSLESKADDNLRNSLEQVWNDHIAAYNSGNESSIKETMSSVAFGTMMNNLSDARQKLTLELTKRFAKNAPDISQMRFIKVIENGPTVGLVYAKDSEFHEGSSKPHRTFAFIKFVKEKAKWKVDLVFTYECDKYRPDGKECLLDMNDLPSSAAIDGKVREAPQAKPVPFAAGYLDVTAGGYKTSVIINSVQQYVRAEGGSKLITGGLRKGTNTVTIVFERNDEKSTFEPSVTIRRIVGEMVFKEVFKYEPKSNIDGEHTLKFTIDE